MYKNFFSDVSSSSSLDYFYAGTLIPRLSNSHRLSNPNSHIFSLYQINYKVFSMLRILLRTTQPVQTNFVSTMMRSDLSLFSFPIIKFPPTFAPIKSSMRPRQSSKCIPISFKSSAHSCCVTGGIVCQILGWLRT